MTITAQEVRVGDAVSRPRDEHYRQAPWSGIVVDIQRAERDGREIRLLVVRGERWNTDHYLDLTAPVLRVRSGFEEYLPEHIPFSLCMVRCTLCQALVPDGGEFEHVTWHVGLMSQLHNASQSPDPRLWSQH